MADFNTSPQLAHATGSVVEREVRQVSNRELQEHKDKIIAWYRHGTLKDLPRLGEERLGIKARCVLSIPSVTSRDLICTPALRHTGLRWTGGGRRNMSIEGIKCTC
jgi:hypothetical protein